MKTITEHRNGYTVSRILYTDAELEAAWNQDGQGNAAARRKDCFCVVIRCSKPRALQLSRAFVETIFAIPTCCYYDGKELSLYCGDAGGDWRIVMDAAQNLEYI